MFCMVVSHVRCFVSLVCIFFFFFNDTATTEIYTLSLHDALPIFEFVAQALQLIRGGRDPALTLRPTREALKRSEEHTSELQSLAYLVCRLLLEKKKKNIVYIAKASKTNTNILAYIPSCGQAWLLS